MKKKFISILLAVPMIGITSTGAAEENSLVIKKEYYNPGNPLSSRYNATVRDKNTVLSSQPHFSKTHLEPPSGGDHAPIPGWGGKLVAAMILADKGGDADDVAMILADKGGDAVE